jgi:hypothetical protein
MATEAQGEQRSNRALAAEPHVPRDCRLGTGGDRECRPRPVVLRRLFLGVHLEGAGAAVGWVGAGLLVEASETPNPETERWLRFHEAWEAVTREGPCHPCERGKRAALQQLDRHRNGPYREIEPRRRMSS